MALKGTTDPERTWWPYTYSGCHVRHKDCGGWLYYQCDDALTITATDCDKCNPGMFQHQYNLLDWGATNVPNDT